MRIGLYVKSQILMKLKFSQQIFGKYSSSQFHENPSIGTELFHADEQI